MPGIIHRRKPPGRCPGASFLRLPLGVRHPGPSYTGGNPGPLWTCLRCHCRASGNPGKNNGISTFVAVTSQGGAVRPGRNGRWDHDRATRLFKASTGRCRRPGGPGGLPRHKGPGHLLPHPVFQKPPQTPGPSIPLLHCLRPKRSRTFFSMLDSEVRRAIIML